MKPDNTDQLWGSHLLSLLSSPKQPWVLHRSWNPGKQWSPLSGSGLGGKNSGPCSLLILKKLCSSQWCDLRSPRILSDTSLIRIPSFSHHERPWEFCEVYQETPYGQPWTGGRIWFQGVNEYLFPTGLLPTVLTEALVLAWQFPRLEETVKGLLLSQENKKKAGLVFPI